MTSHVTFHFNPVPPMNRSDTMLANNRRWVRERTAEDPDFFRRQASEHRPHTLWIGCSDARVPADLISQTEPGELFVHRNIANQVVPTDTNLLAVLQYAVDVLGVQDVIVCGHEECGGVKAALEDAAPPTVSQWLAQLRTVARLHDDELSAIADPMRRYVRLVELNVAEQVYNLSRTMVVEQAWARGKTLRLHGWVYGLREGLLRDVGVTLDGTPAAERREEAPSAAGAPERIAESALRSGGGLRAR
jgi:carbonic anhydrase